MKVLLLTDVPPCKEFSGALLTYHLCKTIPPENIVCAAVRNNDLSYVNTSDDLTIETRYFTKPRENTFWFLNGKIWPLTYCFELYNEFFKIPGLAQQIIEFGREKKIDRIWCILQGQTMIRLTNLVSNQLKVPLLTQVWDHPIWWMGNNKIDTFSSKRIISLYKQAISTSACCGAASFAMADQIIEHHHVPSLPLVSCLPITYARNASSFPRENNKTITIGFSGQTYADQAINALYASLEALDWEISGKIAKLRSLGYNFSLGGHRKRNIEYLGYRDQKETIDLLSECDLLFCPYITDPAYTLVAQTSFPAKLTTYLATGVPVLFVGTMDSSPAKFLRENNAGFICSEPNYEKLVEMIQQIFSSRETYELVAKNGLAAFHKYLTNENQAKLFSDFLRHGD